MVSTFEVGSCAAALVERAAVAAATTAKLVSLIGLQLLGILMLPFYFASPLGDAFISAGCLASILTVTIRSISLRANGTET